MINYIYCPFCRGTLVHRGYEIGTYSCTDCKKKIHLNSSPASSIFPIKDNKVLLAVRGVEPQKGKYDAIGGFLLPGEHPEKGVIRETKEETGLNILPTQLLGIYMENNYIYQGEKVEVLNLYYVGKIKSGSMIPSDDISSLHWFFIDKVPKTGFKSVDIALIDLQKWFMSKK